MRLTHRRATLLLAEPFRISRETSVAEDVLWVEVAHDGVSGFGEAQPQAHYGESVPGAEAFLDEAAQVLGEDPFALEAIERRIEELPGNHAAKAALDAALHDLCGKLVGQPAWRLLGLAPGGPPTSWTIWLGDPDDMAARAERTDPRFRRLKLKLGGRDGLDIARVEAVRGVTDLPLQVDVNEYWDADEALEAIPQLAVLGVQYVEQPLPAGDPEGERLKRESSLPIYVDEDVHTLATVAECARARARHQHQAREERRHPGGRAHGPRGPGARAWRDARVHDRVRTRHRGRSPDRKPLRPPRSRRQSPYRR